MSKSDDRRRWGFEKQFPRAKLLLQVHDELIFECDTSEVAEIKALIKEMEEVVQLSVPLRVSIESGKSWEIFTNAKKLLNKTADRKEENEQLVLAVVSHGIG